MERDLTRTRFNIIIFCMRISGIPIFIERKTKMYLAYEILVYVCGCSSFIACWLDVLLNQENLKEFLASVRVSIQILISAWILFYMKFHVKSVENLLRFTEQFTWEELPQKDPENGKITSAGVALIIQKMVKFSLIAILTFHFIQSTYRMLTKHEMIYLSWYPYDFKASPAYELTNLSQVLASIVAATSLHFYFGFYGVTVSIACSQFYKLKLALLNIRDKQEPSTEELTNCIRHHQIILMFLDEIELAFNRSIFGILFVEMTVACLCAFSVTTNWDVYADLLQALLILAISMGGISMLCWGGNILTESAESVKEAAYSVDWVEAPETFKRSLLLMITRTNKEFTLTAGKFIPVNNKTMMNIFNEICSLILFLLEMKNRYIQVD
ncbi:Odorant receptor 84 [Blattella germanica]|nr:Odorant receptor 84 [Blattella germanica]